jgi:hypothetical protein
LSYGQAATPLAGEGGPMRHLLRAAAVLLPTLMLLPTGLAFGVDWGNHLWLVGSFGDHFRRAGRMPLVLDTQEISGLAFPVFYGYLLYPALGLFSAILHPEIVVKTAVVVLFAAQFAAVRQAAQGGEGFRAAEQG